MQQAKDPACKEVLYCTRLNAVEDNRALSHFRLSCCRKAIKLTLSRVKSYVAQLVHEVLHLFTYARNPVRRGAVRTRSERLTEASSTAYFCANSFDLFCNALLHYHQKCCQIFPNGNTTFSINNDS